MKESAGRPSFHPSHFDLIGEGLPMANTRAPLIWCDRVKKSDSRKVKQRFAEKKMGDNVTLNTQVETKSENRNVTTDDW